MPKYEKCRVKLVGRNGNAFAILGNVKNTLTKYLRNVEKIDSTTIKTEIDAFMAEATSGNYDNLLITCMNWVSVE